MESAVNMFTDGITSDAHPLTTQNNLMTDALNATTITFNGNEHLLQNDMGNTLIQDTTTGNVMQLSEGFIPVGIKEYGGILYIASHNPKTGDGELGSIPSPKIDYIYADPELIQDAKSELVNTINFESESENYQKLDSLYDSINQLIIPISGNVIFNPGDQFIVVLNLEDITTSTIRTNKLPKFTRSDPGRPRGDIKARKSKNPNHNILDNAVHLDNKVYSITSKDYKYPVISEFVLQDTDTYKKVNGWYDIELYALISGRPPILLSDIMKTPQEFYVKSTDVTQTSKYWFIPSNMKLTTGADFTTSAIDIEACLMSSSKGCNVYRKYPNIPRGRLGIKIIPKISSNFKLIENFTTKFNSPFTYGYIEDFGKVPKYIIEFINNTVFDNDNKTAQLCQEIFDKLLEYREFDSHIEKRLCSGIGAINQATLDKYTTYFTNLRIPNFDANSRDAYKLYQSNKDSELDQFEFNYIINIPGFTYLSEGPLWVDKIVISEDNNKDIYTSFATDTPEKTLEFTRFDSSGKVMINTYNESVDQKSNILSRNPIAPETTFYDLITEVEDTEPNKLLHKLCIYPSWSDTDKFTQNYNENEHIGLCYLKVKSASEKVKIRYKFYSKGGNNYVLLNEGVCEYAPIGLQSSSDLEFGFSEDYIKDQWLDVTEEGGTFDIKIDTSPSNSLYNIKYSLNKKCILQEYNSITKRYYNLTTSFTPGTPNFYIRHVWDYHTAGFKKPAAIWPFKRYIYVTPSNKYKSNWNAEYTGVFQYDWINAVTLLPDNENTGGFMIDNDHCSEYLQRGLRYTNLIDNDHEFTDYELKNTANCDRLYRGSCMMTKWYSDNLDNTPGMEGLDNVYHLYYSIAKRNYVIPNNSLDEYYLYNEPGSSWSNKFHNLGFFSYIALLFGRHPIGAYHILGGDYKKDGSTKTLSYEFSNKISLPEYKYPMDYLYDVNLEITLRKWGNPYIISGLSNNKEKQGALVLSIIQILTKTTNNDKKTSIETSNITDKQNLFYNIIDNKFYITNKNNLVSIPGLANTIELKYRFDIAVLYGETKENIGNSYVRGVFFNPNTCLLNEINDTLINYPYKSKYGVIRQLDMYKTITKDMEESVQEETIYCGITKSGNDVAVAETTVDIHNPILNISKGNKQITSGTLKEEYVLSSDFLSMSNQNNPNNLDHNLYNKLCVLHINRYNNNCNIDSKFVLGIDISLSNGNTTLTIAKNTKEDTFLFKVTNPNLKDLRLIIDTKQKNIIKNCGIYPLKNGIIDEGLLKDENNSGIAVATKDITDQYVVLPGVFCFSEYNKKCYNKQYYFYALPNESYQNCIGWYLVSDDSPSEFVLITNSHPAWAKHLETIFTENNINQKVERYADD